MSENVEPNATTRAQPAPERTAVSLPWILAVLLHDRWLIMGVAGVGLVTGLTLGVLKRATYTSTFSFLSRSPDDQDRAGLASLAGQFGISIGALRGSSPPPQLYADLTVSRSLLSAVAKESVTVSSGRRITLSDFFEVKGSQRSIVVENTMRVLGRRVISPSVATYTTGVVTVSVRTAVPEVSFQIAQRVLENLNRFPTEIRRSQAAEERRFTENRLAEAKGTLRAAEDALQRFLQRNKQYASSAELTFQKGRLEREVDLQQHVVSGLAQQYEDARIREVRDTPVLTVIDPPTLPVLPDSRSRILLVVVLTMLALFMGATFAIAREGWRRQQRGDPDSDDVVVQRKLNS